MEWMLLAFLIAFALLAHFIRPLYEKWYDSGVISFQGTYEQKFSDYLERFDEEVRARADYSRYSERGYGKHHLDGPAIWQEVLITTKERRIRQFSTFALVVYALLLIAIISDHIRSHYGSQIASIKDVAEALAPFSVIAALYWRHRRSFIDGSLQGYLNGYMDALEHSALKSAEDEDIAKCE